MRYVIQFRRVCAAFFCAATLLSVLLSCGENPVTILDEYDTPSQIVVTGRNNSLLMSFYSLNNAGDFLGFNIYISSTSNIDDAMIILNTNSSYPSFYATPHSYKKHEYVIDKNASGASLTNGDVYYIAVSAYGANEFVDGGIIETSDRTMYRGIPRPEAVVTLSNNTFSNSTADGLAFATNTLSVEDAPNLESAITSLLYIKYSNQFDSPRPLLSAGMASGFSVQDIGFHESGLSNISMAPADGYAPAGTFFPLIEHHVYALYNGTYYVLIRIEDFEEKESYDVSVPLGVKIRWALQTKATVRQF